MRLRSRNYLNVVLTINALLLGGLLWTQVAGRPLTASTAFAAAPAPATDDERGPTIPNAADQRRLMIDSLKRLEAAVETTNRVLSLGKFRVQVTNVDEFSGSKSHAKQD